MKKLLLSIALFAGVGFSSTAQYVNIPDANFKAYLVGNLSINTNADTEIETNEATTFNGSMSCANLNISDLTGIEAFTGGFTLNCSGNQLTTLDLSANVNMGGHLHVEGNVLTSIVMPNSPNVTQFTYSGNNITSLDLSNTPGITTMWGMNNPLASIDLSNSSALEGMNIDGNSLTSIDLSNLTNLQWISTSSSALTSLDISSCSILNNLYCQYSPNLTELNMANGYNMNFPPNWFDATECPLLTCVTVDNVSFANAVWTSAVDPGVSFSLNCAAGSPPATSISIQGQGGVSTITVNDGTLQMVSTVLPATASQTVVWGISVGGSLASISVSGLLTAIDNGAVTVAAMTNDGTNLTASTVITISNQVLALSSLVDTKVNIYPNPTLKYLMVESDNQIESISIYNMLGELVQQENEASFSVEELKNGIYMIDVTTVSESIQLRFVKE